MLKGDLRKKQILETAEKMFCRDGYEKTSVQDILDALHLSKGSFYHHYESKEVLLAFICEKRAQASAEEQKDHGGVLTGIAAVDRTLSAMIPFNGAGLAFLKMIMPVFLLPEGRSVRDRYQHALKEAFFPILMEAFDGAVAGREIFCENAEFTAGVCLDLVNDMWCALSEQMLKRLDEDGGTAAPGELLETVEQYRGVLEKVLTAPYGSLRLIGMEDLDRLNTEISDLSAKKLSK